MVEQRTNSPVDVILLGGKDPDAREFNNQYKYNLEINGNKILNNVLSAINYSKLVNKVIFVTPESEVKGDLVKVNKDFYITEPVGKLWDNLSLGIEKQQQLGGNQNVLIVCSDLPFLSSKSIDWLILNSQQTDDLYIPTVSKKTMNKLTGIYETYYWPMKEESFKFGNNIYLNINNLAESKIPLLINEYRENQYSNYFLMACNRIGLLCKYGGEEAIYTLFVNYLSKFVQIKIDTNIVPFSSCLKKDDYEGIISKIFKTKTKLLDTPYAEIALDVDSQKRFEIFKKAYFSILDIVNNSN